MSYQRIIYLKVDSSVRELLPHSFLAFPQLLFLCVFFFLIVMLKPSNFALFIVNYCKAVDKMISSISNLKIRKAIECP